jgi:hypothetical protein
LVEAPMAIVQGTTKVVRTVVKDTNSVIDVMAELEAVKILESIITP